MFGLVWFGYWMADLVPLQLLLPQQLETIDPAGKVHDFAVVNAVSGLVALLALPLCGALCDRSRSRFGRRKLWLAAGTLAFAAGLAVTGEQTTLAGVTTAWAAAMLGLSAATAGLTAVIADRVPTGQRGLVTSAIYGPQALGVVAGTRAWRNWAGNVTARPAREAAPASVEELRAAVRRAAEDGLAVKAVGSGHSFTAATPTAS